MEGIRNSKEQNPETNHTNQALKATKKIIVGNKVLPVSSLETKVGRYGYLLHECVRVEDLSDAARVADAVSRPR